MEANSLTLVTRFPPWEVASKIAVSLGIGLLIGIEREWSNKDLGARTFALTTLLGTLAVLLGPSMAVVSFIGVFILVAFANAHTLLTERRLEATTSAALLVMFVLGALIGQGHLFTPVASAILVTMLLAWKTELQRFAGGLTPDEIRSAVLLGLLAFVIYPLLPNRFVDKWQLINPREAWVMVIVIAGIGFTNYILLRLYGSRGFYLSGFLGGFVNSTAAAAEIARLLGTSNAPGTAAVALLLTIVAMFARNLVILALFSPAAVATAAGPLLVMTIVALLFVRRTGRSEARTDIHLESPVSIKLVVTFGAFFLLIEVISTLGERYFGKVGFLAISLLGGLVSSASTSAAAASMVIHKQIAAPIAGEGVVVASLASALVNLPIIYQTAKNPILSRRLTVLTAVVSLAGIASLVLERYLSLLK